MRIKIEVRIDGGGWLVRVLDAATGNPAILRDPHTGDSAPAASRRLGCLGQKPESPRSFPIPPVDEIELLNPAEPHHAIVVAAAAGDDKLTQLHERITARQPGSNRPELFGRYLFEALLGAKLWEQLQASAGSERLDLVISLMPADRAMNRLPWEMMHNRQKFIAQEPRVTTTREVAGAGVTLNTLTSPPRVLFVIGGELSDRQIRAGAEYLGLLRALRSRDLYLRHEVLLNVPIESMTAAVEEFHPTVVHFICHGGFAQGKPYLRMMRRSENNTLVETQVYPSNLIEMLNANGRIGLPEIVVLNACDTAVEVEEANPDEEEAGQVAFPFATDLIQQGVPVVAGMAGQVADTACRLFTRRFYEALLEDGDIAYAAAVGRRAGISSGGSDPKTTLDWMLPTLFMSDGVQQTRIAPAQEMIEKGRNEVAGAFATPGYPAFCGRLDVFQLYGFLMADSSAQRAALNRTSDLQVIPVKVDKSSSAESGRAQYGLTWLLRELAAKAARDGHVPCVVIKDFVGADMWPPRTPLALINAVRIACINTIMKYNAQFHNSDPRFPRASLKWRHTRHFTQDPPPADQLPPNCDPDVDMLYAGDRSDPRLLAAALRVDLLEFLDEVRAAQLLADGEAGADGGQIEQPSRLLLLVDDVHDMGEAAGFLLRHLLDDVGLRMAKDRVRIVFTYSSIAKTGQDAAVKTITDWLSDKNWAHSPLTLSEFKSDPENEDRLAYNHFLFNWQDEGKPRRLVPRRDNNANVDEFFVHFTEAVKGIPSNFRSMQVKQIIDMCARENGRWRALDVANDDEILKQTV